MSDDSGRRWERWPLQWLGLAAGGAVGLCDALVSRSLGIEITLARHDVAAAVLAFFGATYAGLGYVLGHLIRARAAMRRDADLISRQLRDLERAQQQIVQQEKLAAVGRLAAGVAHEVRNPLGVIRASAAMVQESFESHEDPHRACDFICQEIDRLNGLITALLTFSRPTELRREAVSIEKLIERALALARDGLEHRGVALRREIDAHIPELSADPDLVAQVVYDLVSNASEVLESGGHIVVRAGRSAESILVDVADDGPGIEPETAEQIFEPFFTTKATGTGLGLPMAQRIVEAHGGSLRLLTGQGAGDAGRGACFRIELPQVPPIPRAPGGFR